MNLLSLKDHFLSNPNLPTFAGSWLIFLGTISLFVSNVFLSGHVQEGTWLSMLSMVIVCAGSLLIAVNSYINAPLLIQYGSNILAIGLLLFTSSLVWAVDDIRRDMHNRNPERYIDNSQRRAKLAIAGTVVIIVAVTFFVIKQAQRFIQPYFGPPNYGMFGTILFGSGAFTHMILQIKLTGDAIEVCFLAYFLRFAD